MGLLAQTFRPVKAETVRQDGTWLSDWFRGGSDDTAVNSRTALRISTVWKCVRARAETFGMLPKKLFERAEILGRPGQREATQHPLFDVIHRAPNPTITSMDYFQLVSADLDTWGNHYARIERGSQTGRIRYLWRIQPDQVRLDTTTGVLLYMIPNERGVEEPHLAETILHIRGLGYDGIRGYNPIELQKRALGWNAKAARASSNFFENASRPSFIASTPAAIKDQAAKAALIQNLTKSGSDMGKGVLVEGPIDVKMLSISPDDAQFFETYQITEEDICGIFRVPPHKIGILRRATNNNIEQQDIEWVRDSIQPICERVEQWFDLQLLSDAPSSGRGGGTERDRFFMECELKGLLRGDTAAQTAFLEKMLDRGVFSGNMTCDFLGLSPFEGGDRRYINRAYIPIDKVDEVLEKEGKQKAATPTTEETEQKDTVRAMALPSFRDVVGRVMLRRTKEDRESMAPIACSYLLVSLNDVLRTHASAGFISDYLTALAKRAAADWPNASVETIAANECDRAIEALRSQHGA